MITGGKILSVQTEFIVFTLQEFENHAAQLDGAKLELLKKLNNIAQIKTKVDIVNKAEEHAEKLNREAAEFQQ